MTIKVCVGSSCHLKGTEPAARGPQVEETPEGFFIHGVNAGNVEELFATEIYPKLGVA